MTRFFFWLNTACLVLLCSQTHAIAVAGHVIMVKGDVIAVMTRDSNGRCHAAIRCTIATLSSPAMTAGCRFVLSIKVCWR